MTNTDSEKITYDALLQVLESDEPLSAKQEAAAHIIRLIALETPYPGNLSARLDNLYSRARDIRLSTDLLKAKNNLRIFENDICPPKRHAGPARQKSPELLEALERLRRLHDKRKTPAETFDARYTIESLISEGGMGKIFKAKRRADNQLLAIKFLADRFLTHEKIRRRFEREYRLLQAIDHPNIVKVYDFGADIDQCYIVMDYFADGDLAARIKSRPIDVLSLVRLFQEVCKGLCAIHEKGIIHRDIKPSNILLFDEDGIYIPKLTDFGLALDTSEDGLTRTGTQMGTLAFSSPEQIANPSGISPASDIFSLGVTMYYTFSNGLFPSGDYPELSKLNKNIPIALNGIIEKCLERRPENRWTDVNAVSNALALMMNHAKPHKIGTGNPDGMSILRKTDIRA